LLAITPPRLAVLAMGGKVKRLKIADSNKLYVTPYNIVQLHRNIHDRAELKNKGCYLFSKKLLFIGVWLCYVRYV
jgi:hypothetical protein